MRQVRGERGGVYVQRLENAGMRFEDHYDLSDCVVWTSMRDHRLRRGRHAAAPRTPLALCDEPAGPGARAPRHS